MGKSKLKLSLLSLSAIVLLSSISIGCEVKKDKSKEEMKPSQDAPNSNNEYLKLSKPIEEAKKLLKNLEIVKTEKEISNDFNGLMIVVATADKMFSDKIQDNNQISTTIANINSFIKTLNEKFSTLEKNVKSKLENDILKEKERRDLLNINASNDDLRKKISEIDAKINEAEPLLDNPILNRTKINSLINEIDNIVREFQEISERISPPMPGPVDEFKNLEAIIKTAVSILENNKNIKDDVVVRESYNNLDLTVKKSNLLLKNTSKKAEDALILIEKIKVQIETLKLKIKELENKRLSDALTLEVNKSETELAKFNENNNAPVVTKKTSLMNKITEVKNYLSTNNLTAEQNNVFISELKKLVADLIEANRLNPVLKNLHVVLVVPTNSAKTLLDTVATFKNNNIISASYLQLDANVTKAEVLITNKSQVKTEIDSLLLKLKNNTEELKRKIEELKTSIVNNFNAELTKLEQEVAALMPGANNEIVAKINELKKKINDSKTLLNNTNALIFNSTNTLTSLKTLLEQIKTLIKNTPPKTDPTLNILRKFGMNFHSKIQTNLNNSTTLPSMVQVNNLSIKPEFNVDGVNVQYTLNPNDFQGVLGVSAVLTKDGFSFSVENANLPIMFKKVALDITNLFGQYKNISNFNEKDFNEYASLSSGIIRRIESLDKNDTDIVSGAEEILKDKVATFIYLIDADGKNKEERIKITNDNLINAVDSNTTSKLHFISTANYPANNKIRVNDRWEYIRRIIITNSVLKQKSFKRPSLKIFNTPAVDKFIVQWFKDYINKYYNDSIKEFSNFTNLYKFDQPFRTLELFELLKSRLDDETKTKTLNVLKKFSPEFLSNPVYKTGEGVVKTINFKALTSIYSLSISNYLKIENLEANKNIINRNFELFKNWIKDTNFNDSRILPTSQNEIITFFTVLKYINEFYNELSSKSIDTATIDFTKLNESISRNLKSRAANINFLGGGLIMEAIAHVYDAFNTIPTQQKKVLDIIKAEIIKGRNDSNFDFFSDLSDSHKAIWRKFF